MSTWIERVGLVAGVALPLFNIPLIMRIVKRKSSEDISLCWALGVWVCFVLMAPSGFQSADIVWRTFSIVNMIMFTMVVIAVLYYRKGKNCE